MDFTPKQFRRDFGEAMRSLHATPIALLPGTPPVDVSLEAGLLAHGSSQSSRLPEAFRLSGNVERTLTVHSCGGSPGLAIIMSADRIPILALDPIESKEPRTLDIVDEVKIPSTTMMAAFQDGWG